MQQVEVLREIQNSLPPVQHLAVEYCRDGYSRILRYEFARLKNHENLLDALTLLLKSQRIQSTAPQPVIGLGYILWLTGAVDAAQYFFQTALKLGEIAELTEKLMVLTRGLPISPEFDDDNNDILEIESGILYDKLEVLIILLTKTLKTTSIEDLPLAEVELRNFESYTFSLKSAYRHIFYHLDRLEPYAETLTLYNQLQPLETALKRFHRTLKLGQRIDAFRQKVEATTSQISRYIKALKTEQADVDAIETQIEDILDAVDHFDCELDEIEALGISLVQIETRFTLLKFLLEELFDRVESYD